MDTVNFLEQLANNTSFGNESYRLIAEQASDVKKAFLENNADLLKNKFLNVGYLANATQVIEI